MDGGVSFKMYEHHCCSHISWGHTVAVEHINCEMVHIDPSISNERLIKQIRVLGCRKRKLSLSYILRATS